MAANPQEGALSLELLALTSPGEFVTAFLSAHGIEEEEYSRSASGSRSSAATLEDMCGRWGDHAKKGKVPVEGLTIEHREREGGGEGEGETVYRVYAVVKDGKDIAYFATNGYYASEYGTDWDNTYNTVYPRQVVVTQYFTSKE